MSSSFQGTFFDGETLAAIPVTFAVTAGRLQSDALAPVIDVSLADIRCSDRLGDMPRFLYLPDGRTIETVDNVAIDQLLTAQNRGRISTFVHALEQHSRVAAFATVLLVAATTVGIWWGLPVLARHAAMAVPARIEQQAGRAGLASFNQMLAPSGLSRGERQHVQVQLDRLVQAGAIPGSPQLEFRSMGGKFPNAFALPGGIIVMSDELVRLADDDDELAAVLAHEIGHWQRRHGLQTVLRGSAALLVVSTVTGDLSTLTTFASTIPFVLLQRGYSREFEAEADRYAVELLKKANISTYYFRSILEKLQDSRPAGGADLTYLNTHPSTADRIQSLGLDPAPPPKPEPEPSISLPVEPDPVPAFDRNLSPNNLSLQGQATKLWPKEKAQRSVDIKKTFSDPVRNVDVQPTALVRAAPKYPAELRKKGISGSVVIEFIITAEGTVRDITVVRSTHREFEAPAIEAVQQWQFTPARKNDANVATLASQLLEFNALE